MKIEITTSNPRVYFLEFLKRKWILRSGWYNGKHKVGDITYLEIQGTRHIYTKVAKEDYFGTDKAKAMAECNKRNRESEGL